MALVQNSSLHVTICTLPYNISFFNLYVYLWLYVFVYTMCDKYRSSLEQRVDARFLLIESTPINSMHALEFFFVQLPNPSKKRQV